jgi:hypothetical protein
MFIGLLKKRKGLYSLTTFDLLLYFVFMVLNKLLDYCQLSKFIVKLLRISTG